MARYPLYHKSRLPNGVVLVSETYPQSRTLSLGVWVRVGSAYESGNDIGLSHCIEHLVFKGTENRTASEIATSLEALGGDLNAFTERELTCFHATVLCEDAEAAIEVLSDLVFHPRFDPEEFEKERQVLLQELSMIEDSPDDMIHDLLVESVWRGHPLAHNIIGTRKTLLGFNRDQILAHYTKYYRPENMVISVAGGLDHRTLLSLCKKYFCDEAYLNQRGLQLPEIPKVKFSPALRKVKSRSEQTHVMMGFSAPSLCEPGRFEALILSVYLGGGMSSRLFQEVREKAALAYTVESDYVAFEKGGLVSIYAQIAPRSIKPYLEILARELAVVAKESVPPDRLKSIKGQLRGALLLSHEMMETRQEALARHEFFFRRYFGVEELIGAIQRVSRSSIAAVARRLFQQKHMGCIVSGRVPPRMPRIALKR